MTAKETVQSNAVEGKQSLDVTDSSLWKVPENYPQMGFAVPPLPAISDWSKSDDYWRSLMNLEGAKKYIALTGPKKEGKTLVILRYCHEYLKEKRKPVLYFKAQKGDSKFVTSLNKALTTFDPNIPRAQNLYAAVETILWLLESGVYVVIDDYQNIRAIPNREEIFHKRLLPIAKDLYYEGEEDGIKDYPGVFIVVLTLDEPHLFTK